MIWIGVDPGKSGAWAVIHEQHVDVHPWGEVEFAMDMERICAFKEPIVCAVEKVGAHPGEGVVGVFNFGKTAGIIEGVLIASDIPYQLVPPAKWKKTYSLSSDKNQSIEVCKRLFPGVSLKRTERCRKDDHNMAEALLMAEYARRVMR